jgi:hypothetical protein
MQIILKTLLHAKHTIEMSKLATTHGGSTEPIGIENLAFPRLASQESKLFLLWRFRATVVSQYNSIGLSRALRAAVLRRAISQLGRRRSGACV